MAVRGPLSLTGWLTQVDGEEDLDDIAPGVLVRGVPTTESTLFYDVVTTNLMCAAPARPPAQRHARSTTPVRRRGAEILELC